ncbi:hypothetical protein VTO73DRAFT_5335 [Trametes versicolor]
MASAHRRRSTFKLYIYLDSRMANCACLRPPLFREGYCAVLHRSTGLYQASHTRRSKQTSRRLNPINVYTMQRGGVLPRLTLQVPIHALMAAYGRGT